MPIESTDGNQHRVWQVQCRQPCSAQVPHDSITRFLSASRARNTRLPALLADSPRCSANALTGVPFTSIARSASAYSAFNVLAMHQRIQRIELDDPAARGPRVGKACGRTEKRGSANDAHRPRRVERNGLVEFLACPIGVPVEVKCGVADGGVSRGELRIQFEGPCCGRLGSGKRLRRRKDAEFPRAKCPVDARDRRVRGGNRGVDGNNALESIQRQPDDVSGTLIAEVAPLEIERIRLGSAL